MSMRSSAAGRVGIAMVLGGVLLYAGLKHWVDTRNFHPVSVPITLETGEIVEQKFTVNVGGEYWANFESPPHPWKNEIDEDWAHLHFQFEIRNASGEEVPTYSWSAQPDGTLKGAATCVADLKRGEYSAKLVMLNGSRLLSGYQPRLNIQTDRTFPDFLVVLSGWLSAFVITAGLMVVLQQSIVARQEKVAEEKAFATPPTGSYPSEVVLRRVRDKGQFGRRSQWELYSHWALYMVLFLVLVWVPVCVITGLRWPVRGIWVRVLLPEIPSVVTKVSPTPKLVLRVVCNKSGTAYMINGRLQPSKDSEDELKHQLARQPNWTVYVDGDSDCGFRDVVDAIDIVRAAHAKVVLVTPSSRSLIEGDAQQRILGERQVIPMPLRRSSDERK